MAYLYKFKIRLTHKEMVAIIHAPDDDAAFTHLDVELEKFCLRSSKVEEVTLHEKKRVGKRSGYIFDCNGI